MDGELRELFANALSHGITFEDVSKIANINMEIHANFKNRPNKHNKTFAVVVTLTILGLPSSVFIEPVCYFTDLYESLLTSRCLVHHTIHTRELIRPVVSCSMCQGLVEIPAVHNMSKEVFLRNYAYTSRPVLIKNGTGNWTALRVFNFRYFKTLYTKLNAFDDFRELGCLFFPYKTNFESLEHLFTLSSKEAKKFQAQWYVGWSNCIPEIQRILRKHYNRPKFLPEDSEMSSLDWIFMGGGGYGAQMHIDAVQRPSWQAMVRGKKTWFLKPPAECESVCVKHFNATMEPSDILVVDTNKWFHSTYIHPGEISVTIGSEFD